MGIKSQQEVLVFSGKHIISVIILAVNVDAHSYSITIVKESSFVCFAKQRFNKEAKNRYMFENS